MPEKEKMVEISGIPVTKIKLFDGEFLIGPPGIGKTEIIKQKTMEMAKKLELEFVDLREASDEKLLDIMKNGKKYCVFYRIPATHLLPEDIGLPHKDTNMKYAEIIPQKILAVLSNPDLACGVLFLDEITNVQREDVLTLLFALINEKELGWYLKLNKNIMIISAGNPLEWSSVANPLPLPLRMGRLVPVRVSPPTVEEWIEYMDRVYGNKWLRVVGAYLLRFKNDFIIAPSEDDDGLSAIPSPRSWTKLATLLYQMLQSTDEEEKPDKEFIEEIIIGHVGPEAGRKLATLISTSIDIDAIAKKVLTDPSKYSTLTETEKILVLNIASQDPKKYKELAKYLATNHRDDLVIMVSLMKKEVRLEMLKDPDYKTIIMNTLKTYKSVISSS